MFMDEKLAQRLEQSDANSASEYVWSRLAADEHFDGEVMDFLGGKVVRSGANSPINFAVGIGLGSEVSERDIDHIEHFFISCSINPTFKLSPFTNKNIWEILKRKGYGISGFLNMWILSLDEWVAKDNSSEDVTIQEVRPERSQLWAETISYGFGEKVPTKEDIAFFLAFYNSPSTTAFLASYKNNPAAAGSVSFHNGAGMLFNMSTIPSFRGLGLQNQLIQHRISFAKSSGCDIVIVQASPDSASQRNIERAGFKLAYTKVILSR